jgi:hypothetical protein
MMGTYRGPKKIASFLVFASLVVGLSGCGRYRPPLPPEYLAPAAVENLVVTPSETSVSFAWTAADTDAQGKELKSAEGFSIERKELVNRGDETNPDVKFERIGYLQDKHVEVRERLRREARAAGKVGRTVKSPEEFTKFTFVDSKPVKGKTYLYQIVPLNQGNTEGVVGQLTKVVFQGAQSAVVAMLPEEMSNAPDAAGTAATSGRGM